jgi:hypothetical protein
MSGKNELHREAVKVEPNSKDARNKLKECEGAIKKLFKQEKVSGVSSVSITPPSVSPLHAQHHTRICIVS